MSDTTEDLDGGLAAIDLYWIPLGAGQHVVRLSGKLFEATSAWLHQRPRFDLYHSALVVVVAEGRFVRARRGRPRARQARPRSGAIGPTSRLGQGRTPHG